MGPSAQSFLHCWCGEGQGRQSKMDPKTYQGEKLWPVSFNCKNFVVLYDIVRCFMVLICIDTVDVILSDGRDTGSGTIINIHIK